MEHNTAGAFKGASSAAGRAMWKRQAVSQQIKDECNIATSTKPAHISLSSGEQIYDISKLYPKHVIKDEQRSAYRLSQEKSRVAREARPTESDRQPLDPQHLTRRLNDVPDVVYKTDCGSNKSLQRQVEDGMNTCKSAFSSRKDRFASTAAYRSSTFARVVNEPYADPQAVGPGTYRPFQRVFNVKKKQIPTPAYISKVVRFKETNAQVSAVLALSSCITNPANERNYDSIRFTSPDKIRGFVLSTTPRFKSAAFPEPYISSKQHRVLNDSPDRFYDVSPSCKFSMSTTVASSSFKCYTMQSRVNRLSSEAAMVHNTPNFPILVSATQETGGPGAYSPIFKLKPPERPHAIYADKLLRSPRG